MTTTATSSPVFVGGYPRSGTTLLASLLDSHPQMMVYPRETHFFRYVLPLFRDDPARALDFLIWDTSQVAWYVSGLYNDGAQLAQFHSNLRARFAQSGGTAADLLQSLMQAHAHVTSQEDRPYWLEKTPHNERYADLIFRWFPRAKILYVIRDPRATFASIREWQRARQQKPMHVVRFCVEWAVSEQAHQRNMQRYAAQIVGYEDLVRSPRDTLAHICQFLGIAFDETLLKPTFGGADFTGFSSYSTYQTQFKQIDPSSLHRWQQTLAPADIAVLDSLLAKPMATYGYERFSAAPPARLRAVLSLYRLVFSAARPVVASPARERLRSLLREPATQLDEYRKQAS